MGEFLCIMVKNIVVTGANAGIGYEIVKQLKLHYKEGARVILCARSQERGSAAQEELKKEGLDVELALLDITDKDSIDSFTKEAEQKFKPIDILINNAGFAFKSAATEPVYEQARKTIDVNYYGTKNFTESVKSLLAPDAKIINVSSSAGKLSNLGNDDMRQRFTREDLQESELSDLMEEFISATKEGNHAEKGWSKSTYSASKIGLSALTRIWARDWHYDVCACCPGWCRTNMAGDKAPKSAAQGAETPVWLATRDQANNGKFYYEKKEADW